MNFNFTSFLIFFWSYYVDLSVILNIIILILERELYN